MAKFAIVRHDGATDKVEGVSVEDVADRYGWPGDGTIEAWDEAAHGANLRHVFASVEEQREKLADPAPDSAPSNPFAIAAARR